MSACNVLAQHHVMVGIDFHDAWMPGPFPMMPHFVTAPLRCAIWGTHFSAQWSPTVLTWDDMETMIQKTDIGSFIPHVPFGSDLLWVVETLFSSSKSEFGVASVEIGPNKGVPGKKGPVAIAPLVVVGFNLNCNGALFPPYWFPNVVIAPNTHQAGFTFQDFVNGMCNMLADAAVQYLVNRLFGSGKFALGSRFLNALIGDALDNAAAKVVNSFVGRFGKGTVAKFLGRTLAETVVNVPGSLVQTLLGTPTGVTLQEQFSATNSLTEKVNSFFHGGAEVLGAPSQ